MLFSLILFTLVYVLLFALFIFLLNHKIQHGPRSRDTESTYGHLRAVSTGRPDGKE